MVKDKQPLISIIIPTYNYEKYLSDAIESALSQTYVNKEIIIIDDGSTDNTKSIIKKYKHQIRYYYKINSGAPNTRNFGVKKSKGSYIVFLDADNKIDKDFLIKCKKILDSNSNISYVYTQLEYFGNKKGVTNFSKFDINTLKFNNYIDACSLMRKEIFSVASYDPQYMVFQDWDFYLSLAEKNIIGQLLDEPLVYYRKHGKSIIDNLDKSSFSSKRKAYIKIILKHRSLFDKYFILRWVIGDLFLTPFEKLKSLKK